MFFRKKEKKPTPQKGEDGYYYAEEGEDYDSDEFETDSDYSSEEVDDEDSEDNNGNQEEIAASSADVNEDVIANTDTNEEEEDDDDDDDDEGELVKWPSTSSSDESYEHVQAERNAKPPSSPRHVHVEVNGGQLEMEVDGEDDDGDDDGMHHSSTAAGEDTQQQQKPHPTTQQSSSNMPSSLEDDRSLLALAAEQDRVDVIQAILQPQNPHKPQSSSSSSTTTSTNSSSQQKSNPVNEARLQLLLNNTLPNQSQSKFTQADILPTFLPPLHIAIASSSTNAASCFLRMGSDPSLRPAIPKDWSGPGWINEETGEDLLQGGAYLWKVMNGKSAWELAFPTESSGKNKDGKNEAKAAASSPTKRSWFGFGSNSTADKEQPVPNISYDPAVLERIRHAFTAEALRAIGSDEVERLKELIHAGLGSNERIEIGGKDLFGWCREMNAVKCMAMIQKIVDDANVQMSEDVHGSKEHAAASTATTSSTNSTLKQKKNATEDQKQKEQEEDDDDDGLTYDAPTLAALQTQLHSTSTQITQLSQALDDLAEEVSVTQGLLLQHGDPNGYGGPSHNALLSQVRSLKVLRGDIEDETSEWEYKVADRAAELKLCIMWWVKRGGVESDIPFLAMSSAEEEVDGERAQAKADREYVARLGRMSASELKAAVKETSRQVTANENKMKKLHASIVDLTQENMENMEKVDELGLMGAVNLTRKLKGEVKERREILEAAMQEEADLRMKVQLVRNLLEQDNVDGGNENKNNDRNAAIVSVGPGSESVPLPASTPSAAVTREIQINNMPQGSAEITQSDNVETEPAASSEDIIESYQPDDSPMLLQAVNSPHRLQQSKSSDGDIDSDSYYSGDDEDDSDYDSYDEDDDDDDDSYEETMPHSERIKQGKSRAVVSWVDDEDLGIFTFKVWDLMKRIFGLSKYAIQKTAKKTVEEVVPMPRVMII